MKILTMSPVFFELKSTPSNKLSDALRELADFLDSTADIPITPEEEKQIEQLREMLKPVFVKHFELFDMVNRQQGVRLLSPGLAIQELILDPEPHWKEIQE